MKKIVMMAAAVAMTLTAGATGKSLVAMNEETENVVVVNYEEASFPGGEQACSQWIRKHLRYPAESLEKGIEGEVVVTFYVEPDGTIGDVKVISATNDEMAYEAVRVVRRMPAWAPGTANMSPVRSRYTLPVRFEIAK